MHLLCNLKSVRGMNKKGEARAREKDQRLGLLAAFPEDLNSVLCTHLQGPTATSSSNSRGCNAPLWPLQVPAHVAHTLK